MDLAQTNAAPLPTYGHPIPDVWRGVQQYITRIRQDQARELYCRQKLHAILSRLLLVV